MNKFGARSTQKAEWPKKMCRQLVRGVDAELSDRTCAQSFPAETTQKVVEELGSLDDPDEAEGPAIGASLSGATEKEQELLDGFRPDCFPDHEQHRREARLQLPRQARASLGWLHVMIGHKLKAGMVQIPRGAKAEPSLIEGTKFFCCEVCDANADTARKSAVTAPPPYDFSPEVLVDVFCNHDMEGSTYGW